MQKADPFRHGHIDFRSLRFLAEALERRSVTRAGQEIGLSQPAASRLMAQLRRAFGDDPLLLRSGKGFVLTARATALLPRLRDILTRGDALFAPPSFDPAQARRTIHVATTDYGSAVVLAPLAQALTSLAPGLSLAIHAWAGDTLEALAEGHLDFSLFIDDPLPPGFRRRELFAEHYACIVRRHHPMLAERDRQGHIPAPLLAELPRVICLRPEPVGLIPDDPLARFGKARTTTTFETPYFLAGPLLVSMSDHQLCTTRRLADMMARMVDVEVVDLPEAGRFSYCAFWHDRAEGDPALAWLLDRIEALKL